MSQTPNVQVPLVYLDRDRAGRITREWLPYLTQAANAAASGDLVPLQAAIAALQAQLAADQATIAMLEAEVATLTAEVESLKVDNGDTPVYAFARRVSAIEEEVANIAQMPIWRT